MRLVCKISIYPTALVLILYSSNVRSGSSLQHDSVNVEWVSGGDSEAYEVKLTALQKDTKLTLRKADPQESVLSPDIHFLIGDVDADGKTVFHKWTPTAEDIESAQTVYVDSNAKAAFRVEKDHGELKLNGIMDGVSVMHDGLEHRVKAVTKQGRSDYININRTLTFANKGARQSGNAVGIIELLLVCDKEFGDVFGQNYQKILDYFTVLMWDVNLRYKTLPSLSLSWRVNGIVVMSNTGAQPYIEESRAPDGRVNHNRVLDKFSFWVYQQRNNLPPFDLASSVSNAKQEWGGGLAYVGAACGVDAGAGRNWGTSVWNDAGDWGALNIVPHELGHNMGAPHDDDSNYPGGCSAGGSYIMGGSTDEHRYFFSSCSDRTIGNFVKSDQAACLRTLSSSKPALSPDFNAPPAPTMTEQCKLRVNNKDAYVDKDDNCRSARCNWPGWYMGFAPLDNSPCANGGRCFRGNCRQPGYLFKNAGSGLCMRASNNFNKMAVIQMQPCPSVGTALDRFVVTSGLKGTFLESPYIDDGAVSRDKCAWTGNAEGNTIWTDTCSDHTSNNDNPWHGWELRDAGNGQFLLYHKVTGRCGKPESRSAGSAIGTYKACDKNNVDYKWTRSL